MLFEKSQITGLFGFENRKMIFEGVDSRFKFVALTWAKGRATTKFPATFMRHDVNELAAFPSRDSLEIGVDLVRKLSPDSLSVMEFKSEQDVEIAQKMLKFPMLAFGAGGWNFEINGEEFHMNRSAHLFKETQNDNPLYEGSLIWHFDNHFEKPRYWIDENDIRREFEVKRAKRCDVKGVPADIRNDYETERIAIRKIASNTNERTLITTLIPKGALTGNSLATHFPFIHDANNYNQPRYTTQELFLLTALLNSFVADYAIRQTMTTNLNSFYIYQLRIPRLTSGDGEFGAIVSASARLICTTAEFDALAREAGLSGHAQGAATPDERAALRAQLDARIARLYGLNETEFAHILATFPLVEQSVKDAALAAFVVG